MSKRLEALPGMEDILPGEVEKWQWVEEKARLFFASRGFHEIRTPLLETTDLFSRSVGEASDIVHKQMFSFEDRGGRHITLRPEMTASVARAVIEHGLLTQAKSLRLYYLGPMFRAERPQAGRKRQFHQIGMEIVNESGVVTDLEAVVLLYDFLNYLGLSDFELRLNDLGSAEEQKQMMGKLAEYFSREKPKLCPDCQWRLERNVLRIFDCKIESCQPVIQKAPWEEISPLSEGFHQLMRELEARKIPFELRRRLVRGLDYYNGPVFEVAAQGLGAQDAVAGGGRYDRLYADLGGAPAPCTGFSIGVERLLMALEKQSNDWFQKRMDRKVYVALLESGEEAERLARDQSLRLCEKGFRIETLPGETSLSRHLKRANQLGVRWVLILGSEEIRKRQWTLKDMTKKAQAEVGMDRLVTHLEEAVKP